MTTPELPPGTPGMVSTAILIVLWAIRQADLFPARYIPLVACGLGVMLVALLEGPTPNAIVLGLVCGAGATGFHQTVKQLKPNENSQDPPASGGAGR